MVRANESLPRGSTDIRYGRRIVSRRVAGHWLNGHRPPEQEDSPWPS